MKGSCMGALFNFIPGNAKKRFRCVQNPFNCISLNILEGQGG